MPSLRDFLSRFRPAGAPGAAARAGVRVDRRRELEAEVGSVLALLAGVHDECEQIVGRARREADGIMASAREEAAAIAADGARRADAAREAAARQLTAVAGAEASAMVAAARQQAGQVEALARQRMPAMAGAAVADIMRLARAADVAEGEP